MQDQAETTVNESGTAPPVDTFQTQARSLAVPAVTLILSDGSHAWVSPEDYPRVSVIAWCPANKYGYVHGRFTKRVGGHGGNVWLHRFILLPPAGRVIDHIDGNARNNTRENLQIVSQSRNTMKGLRALNGGVSFDKQSGRWRARYRVDGKLFDLGLFNTDYAAMRAVAMGRAAAWANSDAQCPTFPTA